MSMTDCAPPADFLNAIHNENPRYVIKSKHREPYNAAIGMVYAGVFFSLFPLFAIYAFLRTSFQDNPSNTGIFTTITTSLTDNFNELLGPAFFTLAILYIGISLVLSGYRRIKGEGPWIALTEKSVARYAKGRLELYPWNTFDPDVTFTTNEARGNVALSRILNSSYRLKGGKRKNLRDDIYIVDVVNPKEVADFCRQRIAECIEKAPTAPMREKEMARVKKISDIIGYVIGGIIFLSFGLAALRALLN